MRIEDEVILQRLRALSKDGESRQERICSHAIVLSHEGQKSHEIANIFDVTPRTVFQWFKDFKKMGLESLKVQSGRGRKSKLSFKKDVEVVKKHIDAHPHQPKRAYALTLEKLDVTISYDTFKRFLKKHSI